MWVNISSDVGLASLDYEQELAKLRASTRELIEDFIGSALSVDFDVEVGGRRLITEIGGLDVGWLRESVGKPSLTLAAVDGSCTVREVGGVVFTAAASASLMYEIIFSGTIWMEKWPERSFEYSAVLPHLKLQHERSLRDETPTYFEAFALSLMKLLEYFAATDALDLADIVLFDGSLSTEYHASLSKPAAEKAYKGSALIGFPTKHGPLDEYDLHLNLYRATTIVPLEAERDDPYRLIFEAEKNGGRLSLADAGEKAVEALTDFASKHPGKISLESDGLTLSEDAMKSWAKIVELLSSFKNFFGHVQQQPPPLKALGHDEVALLRAYALTQLLLKASSTRKLLLSVAKDSSSSSLQELVLDRGGSAIPDKLALEVYSALKAPEKLKRAWCTLDYDPLPRWQDSQSGPNMAKTISRFYAQLFVEGDLRSDVVACEWLRPASNAHLIRSDKDYITRLLLALSQPTRSIPEALGYVYPLFDADKHVKHLMRELARLVDGYAVLLQADPTYREYLSVVKPFRQKRGEFERGRRWFQRTR